ncbi:hypothetical protein EV363DRAFT_1516848, partial [Boletus edulis]
MQGFDELFVPPIIVTLVWQAVTAKLSAWWWGRRARQVWGRETVLVNSMRRVWETIIDWEVRKAASGGVRSWWIWIWRLDSSTCHSYGKASEACRRRSHETTLS